MIPILLLLLAGPAPAASPPRDTGDGRCGLGAVVGSFFPTIDLMDGDGGTVSSMPVPRNHRLPAPLPVVRCGETVALVQWEGRRLAIWRSRVIFDQPVRVIDCSPRSGAAAARETTGNAAAMGMGGRVNCPGPKK